MVGVLYDWRSKATATGFNIMGSAKHIDHELPMLEEMRALNEQVLAERKAAYREMQAMFALIYQLSLRTAEFFRVPAGVTLRAVRNGEVRITQVEHGLVVGYIVNKHFQHIIDVLANHYTLTINYIDRYYLGMKLKWDYTNRTIEISILGCV